MSDTTDTHRSAPSDADLYAVLGIATEADDTQIDHAFRVLARRLHPDTRTADADADPEAFERVIAAYAVLRNPIARRAYDQQRALRQRPEVTTTPHPRVRRLMPDEPPLRVGPSHWDPLRH